ncbi:hypothetical protein SEPCBS119000_003480 [Sporothrix epigloea]|uniref:Protein kinase domain-containing protein n=1 Tax=Sporothrix epigloea TaxID=1892477 RepID=A0ABP0DNN0_9PEZI
MEIYQIDEARETQDGELVFTHANIILRGPNDEFFYATVKDRASASFSVDVSTLQVTPILSDNIWPQYLPHLSVAPSPPPPNSYVKELGELFYDDTAATQQLVSLILHETNICEILKKHPHPNVATYLGCVVQDDKIKGLCFTRYAMTLKERLKMETPFDRQRCIEEVENGIRHLHSLGLVHNDIHPSNIMLDEADHAVIIDFDSCQHEGDKLGNKAGTKEWSNVRATHARRENDFFSLAKVKEHLQL